MSAALGAILRARLAEGRPTALARIARAEGSTPRETGAAMLVGADGAWGTIGGGQLEFHCIDRARALLADGRADEVVSLALGPALGQCCGGRVEVALSRADAATLADLLAYEARAEAARPAALVFGAGHVGRALARALAPLPLAVSLIDDREGVLDGLPAEVALLRLDDPADALGAAPPGAAFVVLTHSHALDYRLVDAALRRGDAAYVGMIGSATKRARFASSFRAGGGGEPALARLACPIGGGDVRDKRPEVIAAMTAADILRALSGPR